MSQTVDLSLPQVVLCLVYSNYNVSAYLFDAREGFQDKSRRTLVSRRLGDFQTHVIFFGVLYGLGVVPIITYSL